MVHYIAKLEKHKFLYAPCFHQDKKKLEKPSVLLKVICFSPPPLQLTQIISIDQPPPFLDNWHLVCKIRIFITIYQSIVSQWLITSKKVSIFQYLQPFSVTSTKKFGGFSMIQMSKIRLIFRENFPLISTLAEDI